MLIERNPRQIILDALNGNLGPTYRDHRPGEHRAKMPRVPSGLADVQYYAGGFYGFTVIQGAPKLGKSLIAQNASALAALDGWEVRYLYGEMTGQQMDERVSNALRVDSPDDWPIEMAEHWRATGFSFDSDIDTLLRREAETIPHHAERALIVIDSMQTLAEHMSDGKPSNYFFTALRRIQKLAQAISEQSNGRVAFIGMSEVNQNGGAKGGKFEYSVQCLLKLFEGKDPNHVKAYLISRDTKGGDLGSLQRVYEECRFRRECDPNQELEMPTPTREPAEVGRLPWE